MRRKSAPARPMVVFYSAGTVVDALPVVSPLTVMRGRRSSVPCAIGIGSGPKVRAGVFRVESQTRMGPCQRMSLARTGRVAFVRTWEAPKTPRFYRHGPVSFLFWGASLSESIKQP